MFLSGTDPGDLATSSHGAQRSPSRSPPGFPRSHRACPAPEQPVPPAAPGGSSGPQPPPRSPTWRPRRRQPRAGGTAPPPPAPPRRRGAARGTRGTAAEPRSPSLSLPLALPAGRPTEAGRAGGSRSPSRFLLHPRRGRNCRAAAAPRRGQVRALTASEEPSGAAAATKFRALSQETESESEGVRAEGREGAVCARHGPALPAPRSAPPPGAAAATLTCSCRCCSSCCCPAPEVPRRVLAVAAWVQPGSVRSVLSPPLLSRGGGRVWERPSPQREPRAGPCPRLRSAPQRARCRAEGGAAAAAASCGGWGLGGFGHPDMGKHRGLRCRSSE